MVFSGVPLVSGRKVARSKSSKGTQAPAGQGLLASAGDSGGSKREEEEKDLRGIKKERGARGHFCPAPRVPLQQREGFHSTRRWRRASAGGWGMGKVSGGSSQGAAGWVWSRMPLAAWLCSLAHCGPELMVGPEDLGGLFQPLWLYVRGCQAPTSAFPAALSPAWHPHPLGCCRIPSKALTETQ